MLTITMTGGETPDSWKDITGYWYARVWGLPPTCLVWFIVTKQYTDVTDKESGAWEDRGRLLGGVGLGLFQQLALVCFRCDLQSV
jgi:hypothetical protein